VGESLTILIAARDEAERIGRTSRSCGAASRSPGDRRRRRLARRDGASRARPRARVVRLPHRGKGQALTLGERGREPGDLLLCDADLRGDLTPLLDGDSDLTIAAFARRQGGGFGIAKGRRGG
jgi:hypothetical protein